MTASGSLVKLAETGDVEPGGPNTFFQIAPTPVLSAEGKVVFHTDLRKNGLAQGWGLFQSGGTNLETVIRTGQPSPDLNGNLYTFNTQVALNSSNRVFEAGLSGTLAGGLDNSALFQLNRGVLTILARAGQIVPGGGATFNGLGGVAPRLNRNGQTAFCCGTSTNPYVMFRATGGVLSAVAWCGQPSPDGNGALQDLPVDPSFNNAGTLAFPATLIAKNSSVYGLFLADEKGLRLLVRTGQSPPDEQGQFGGIASSRLALNDSDQIAFVASLLNTSGGQADNLGLYKADAAGIIQLARKGQLAPGGTGRFLDFGVQPRVSINNSGAVAFLADLTGTPGGNADNAALYLAQGSNPRQIVRKGDPAPDGNGVFSGFGYPSLNHQGQIAFTATLSGTARGTIDNQGIFFVDSSLAVKQVIRAGQLFQGKTISNPTFLDGPNYGGLSGLNDSGQLAIWSSLSGNAAVYLWSNDRAPAGLQLLRTTSVAKDVTVAFQAGGGTTNYLQAAPRPTGPFVDISSLVVSGVATVATNFVEKGGATNPARFYRIRQQ